MTESLPKDNRGLPIRARVYKRADHWIAVGPNGTRVSLFDWWSAVRYANTSVLKQRLRIKLLDDYAESRRIR